MVWCLVACLQVYLMLIMLSSATYTYTHLMAFVHVIYVCMAFVHVICVSMAFVHVIYVSIAFVHVIYVCMAFVHVIYVCMAFVHVLCMYGICTCNICMYVCMYIMLATTLFNRYVVNYDFPRNIEDYVHRVGRTGRAG